MANRKTDDVKRTIPCTIMMYAQEKREYTRVARLAGVPLAVWFRAIARQEAARICKAMKASEPVWEITEERGAVMPKLTPAELAAIGGQVKEDARKMYGEEPEV